MHGNYRHQYLLSSSSGEPAPPAFRAAQSDKSAQSAPVGAAKSFAGEQRHAAGPRQQRPTDKSNSNGLPNYPISHPHHYKPHSYPDQQQQQQLRQQQQAAFSLAERQCNRNNACETNFDQLKHQFRQQINASHHHNHQNHNHHQMIHAKSAAGEPAGNSPARQRQLAGRQHQQQPHSEREADQLASEEDEEEEGYQQNYASQLRSSHLQHRFQHRMQNAPASSGSGSSASSSPQAPEILAPGTSGAHPATRPSQPQPRRSSLTVMDKSLQLPAEQGQPNSHLHVNFNRSNQPGADDSDSDGRKKKYLTAKYGQQQMNLIKKRLKVETWLYEQLKELAKGCNCEAELDEIDIDLDQLLDLEDDDTRRRWLRKTLEPFEELPRDRLNKFIEEVLEQSRLL